jgi:hypothetical protein
MRWERARDPGPNRSPNMPKPGFFFFAFACMGPAGNSSSPSPAHPPPPPPDATRRPPHPRSLATPSLPDGRTWWRGVGCRSS